MRKTIKKISLCILFSMLVNTAGIYANTPETSKSHEKIAIIGGGITGIAAATFLKDLPYEVHLFEKENHLGGNAQTMLVDNGTGEKVAVDLGPQYFAKGPWDLYTEFLQQFDLYNPKEILPFTPGITISNQEGYPRFISPSLEIQKMIFDLFHLKKWCSIYSFYKLNAEAYKLYQAQTRDSYYITAQKWLDTLDISTKDKEEIILPFLASLIGVNVNQARNLSTLVLVRLFAFDAPLKQKKYAVLREGMGSVIQQIGSKIEKESAQIHIHKEAPVHEITQHGNQYIINYTHQGAPKHLLVDKIIATTHPDQAVKLLKNTYAADDPLLSHLAHLPYFDARIVLHRSNLFTSRPELSSFMNLQVNPTGNVISTMQLGKINEQHYGNIHKSWIHDDKIYARLQQTQTILGTATFRHPYVTPQFVEDLDAIKVLLSKNPKYSNLCIAGGWMEAGETQATSILSAYKAVKHLLPNTLKEQQKKKWEKTLPSLTRYWY